MKNMLSKDTISKLIENGYNDIFIPYITLQESTALLNDDLNLVEKNVLFHSIMIRHVGSNTNYTMTEKEIFDFYNIERDYNKQLNFLMPIYNRIMYHSTLELGGVNVDIDKFKISLN